MELPKGAPLGNETAREVCIRAGSRAYIAGSISRLGSKYRITLQAVECESTDVMARAEATADSKEQVVESLGRASKELREKVGESLASLEQFSTPLMQATTSSLEALRAYTMGRQGMYRDPVGSIALYQHAIGLDPNFAMAILSLGLAEGGLNESVRPAENYRKAFDLRGRVSEWEKFAIESRYYRDGVGDLELARRTYATWAKTYPREPIAVNNLVVIEFSLGHFERALKQLNEVDPANNHDPANHGYWLGYTYFALDRFDEAKSKFQEEVAQKTDTPDTHLLLYTLAFLNNDAAEMKQHVEWSSGKAAVEDQFLTAEARTDAYSGHVNAARQLERRAVDLAQQADEKEISAQYQASGGLREALFGYQPEARQRAAAAVKLSDSRMVEYGAGLALAVAGDTRGAQALADDLEKRFPSDTIVRYICLPAIRGWLAIDHKDYAKAVDILQAGAPYELGFQATLGPSIYVAYVRAEAYLRGGRYAEAVNEFQKILDHRGLVGNEPIGALARLNLARAYAGQHDLDKARKQYEDFLTLWKDADPGISILRDAQAEYHRLK